MGEFFDVVYEFLGYVSGWLVLFCLCLVGSKGVRVVWFYAVLFEPFVPVFFERGLLSVRMFFGLCFLIKGSRSFCMSSQVGACSYCLAMNHGILL